MFNYSQIDSDFFNPIVKECRGIILEDYTYKPVCVPFYKFGNYGESYVDNINWNTARVQEKVDGSLIKVWNYNNKWNVSTNGTIYAQNAMLSSKELPFKTFYDLFIKASNNSGLDFNKLNKDYTYMFELISPYNRVVVPYSEISIRHIGTRNNTTLEETDLDIGIIKPKSYGFTTLEECIEMASKLPFSEEGYVVVDKYWHRVKVKSPAYVVAHHLKNNGAITKSRIVDMIKTNETEEFLSYYPEFQKAFDEVKINIDSFIKEMSYQIDYVKTNVNCDNRKEFAEYAKSTICPALLFNWLDNNCINATSWLYGQTSDKIVKFIYK